MRNDEKLILSLYDYSGEWAKPYIKAGYAVKLWDKKVEGDILFSDNAWRSLMGYSEHVYGILAAPPCTFFASSGARWWHRICDEDLMLMIALAQLILVFVEYCDNLKFWALENPVGRIESLVPELAPFRKLSFDPCDYGDPYTKKTILWGDFNPHLFKTPVLPLYGSMMHNVPSGPNQQAIRSKTPSGFAKAFFLANK